MEAVFFHSKSDSESVMKHVFSDLFLISTLKSKLHCKTMNPATHMNRDYDSNFFFFFDKMSIVSFSTFCRFSHLFKFINPMRNHCIITFEYLMLHRFGTSRRLSFNGFSARKRKCARFMKFRFIKCKQSRNE